MIGIILWFDTVRKMLCISMGTEFLNRENIMSVLKGIFGIYND